MQNLKGIGNVLKENQSQHHVLIFRGIHVFSQFIRGLPERCLDGFLFVIFTVCFPDFGHYVSV
jgi:hypothetical protein